MGHRECGIAVLAGDYQPNPVVGVTILRRENMGIWEYYSVSSWKPIPVTALAQHCKKLPPGHEEQEELTTFIAALNFQPNGKLVITPDLSANSSHFINFIPVNLFSIFIYAKKQ